MVATLYDAKEIVFAVDLISLGQSVNNGTGISGLNFGYDAADIIVKCYRTTESEYAASNTIDTDYPGGAMFIGKVLLGLGANFDGPRASLCSLTISLCMNASNAVNIDGRVFKIGTGSGGGNESTSFSGLSGQYAHDEYDTGGHYPNIEKHLYPLYIRYI